MKILVVLACVAMAAARPEAPLQGYNYQAPRPVVHAPVVSSGAHAGAHSHGAGYYQAPAPAVHTQSFGVSGSYQAAPAYQSSGFGSAVSSGQAFGSGGQGYVGGHSSGFGSAVASGSSFAAPQQTVVQKHIYVHVPPQEPEETHHQQYVSQGPARKHYKIIFIKTPNVQPSAAQIALQQAQQEEKTIVYVLVKKPEDQGQFTIPELPAVPPSKPEVYFIKYKANRGGAVGGASGFGGAVGGLGAASSGAHSVSGFDASVGSSASSSASSQVSGSGVHTEYGAPSGHQGYP